MKRGIFTISLDCELYWGVRDRCELHSYRDNLLGDRQVTQHLLNLFSKYQIHATWAFVGFLFFSNKTDLIAHLPHTLPSYHHHPLNPYPAIPHIGDDESIDPFHFGQSLIEAVKRYPHQEIGSHTFSHYYCLERGQTQQQFVADLSAAKQAAKRLDVDLRSLVFPRNQVNDTYLQIAKELGFIAFRGNEASWFYNPRHSAEQSLFQRAGRLLDAYLNITGHHGYDLSQQTSTLCNLPSSRFLRPYSKKLSFLEPLRIMRIKRSMTYAARHGLGYHLWWHPHNFGVNMQENLALLTTLLDHYALLKQKYGFASMNMQEAATTLLSQTHARKKDYSFSLK